MMVTIILAAVIITILLMNFVMFLVLSNVVKITRHQIDEYFVSEFSKYGEKVEEKQTQSRALSNDINQLEQTVKSMRSMIDNQLAGKQTQRTSQEGSFTVPTADYTDKNFFSNYRDFKDLMKKLDKNAIIKDVKDSLTYTGNLEKYNSADSIINAFDFNMLYEMSTTSAEVQYTVLDESFNGIRKELLHDYVKTIDSMKDFEVLKFIEWLKEQKTKNDPNLYVYTGEQDDKFDSIEDKIITRYDKNVCEGIRLVFQNTVYDYSISR